MIETVGRIVVRKNKVAGLFVPFTSKAQLRPGIYDVVKIMDEPTLVYRGEIAMADKADALNLPDLLDYPECLLTQKELDNVNFEGMK